MEKLKIIKNRYSAVQNHWLDDIDIVIPNPSMISDICWGITTTYPDREEKLRIRKERINKILNR